MLLTVPDEFEVVVQDVDGQGTLSPDGLWVPADVETAPVVVQITTREAE